jgi:hypothetical protein
VLKSVLNAEGVPGAGTLSKQEVETIKLAVSRGSMAATVDFVCVSVGCNSRRKHRCPARWYMSPTMTSPTDRAVRSDSFGMPVTLRLHYYGRGSEQCYP